MSDGLRCRSCGKLAEAGDRFCDVCQLPLGAEAQPSAPAPEPAPRIADSLAATWAENLVIANDPPPQPQPATPPRVYQLDPPGRAAEPRYAADTQPGLPPILPQHRDLGVEYNIARIFVEGVCVPFQLRITPQRADIDMLFVEIRHEDQRVARREPDDYLELNEAIELNLPYNPPVGLQGKEVPFRIYIGYSINGERHCHAVERLHTIFRAKEKIKNVLRDIKIDINTQIHSGHASDTNVHNPISAIEHLVPRPDDPAEDIRNVDIPPSWQPLHLRRCKFPGSWPQANLSTLLGNPPAAAQTTKLTLVDGSRRLHLVTGNAVVFGRNRQCDLVLREVDRDGQPPKHSGISQFHGRFELEGRRCTVIDRVYSPVAREVVSSSLGLFLNGVRVSTKNPQALPLDQDFRLSLAGADDSQAGALVYRCHIYSPHSLQQMGAACHLDPSGDALCGMTMVRLGGPTEITALVWRDLPLRALYSQLGDGCFCAHRGGFVLRSGGRCDWLTPDQSLKLGGRELRVSPYHPFGMELQKDPQENK